MDEYEAHVREGRCPVTGVGPGRAAEDAAGELSVDEVVEVSP